MDLRAKRYWFPVNLPGHLETRVKIEPEHCRLRENIELKEFGQTQPSPSDRKCANCSGRKFKRKEKTIFDASPRRASLGERIGASNCTCANNGACQCDLKVDVVATMLQQDSATQGAIQKPGDLGTIGVDLRDPAFLSPADVPAK